MSHVSRKELPNRARDRNGRFVAVRSNHNYSVSDDSKVERYMSIIRMVVKITSDERHWVAIASKECLIQNAYSGIVRRSYALTQRASIDSMKLFLKNKGQEEVAEYEISLLYKLPLGMQTKNPSNLGEGFSVSAPWFQTLLALKQLREWIEVAHRDGVLKPGLQVSETFERICSILRKYDHTKFGYYGLPPCFGE